MTLLGRNLPTDALELNFSRSKCLIISQEVYNDDSYSDRYGTEQDVIALTKTFKDFGCSNDRVKVERHSIYIRTVISQRRYSTLLFQFKQHTNALSFYRSQNVLGWSKYFVPDKKCIYILWQSQTFCARQKDDLHSVKLVFVLAQKFLKRH